MTALDEIVIDPAQDTTLAQQLKQQITWLIASGELQAGEQLPPVQVMARQLGINLHTVRSAYKKLAADGLVTSRQGQGTHVLSFDPMRLARIAGEARSHTIGVIIPSWKNPFYHALLQGIEEVAEEHQTMIFLCNTHDDPNTAWRDFARLAAKQVDGVLVASYNVCHSLQTLQQKNRPAEELPVVTVDWPGCEGFSVLIDLQMAGYQATRHLIEHGHRQIGLITFTNEGENIAPVNDGYKLALEEHQIPFTSDLVARVPGFDIAPGAEGARRLLALKEPPTAIFAITDLLALGAMQHIKQAGLRIPHDIALIGFNDIPTAALVEPALTTVAAPTVQVGREAMKMLQVLITGERPPQRQLTFSTALVVRESCGCPRKEHSGK